MFEFVKTVRLFKFVKCFILRLMCDLGDEQERKGYGLTVSDVFVCQINKESIVPGSFM